METRGKSKTNEFIHRRAQFYHISDEEYREKCVPNFDITRGRNHHQRKIYVSWNHQPCYVDEKLAELVTIINQDALLTQQSCQYDLTGYASIDFSQDGYTYFVNKLITCMNRKYGKKIPSEANDLLNRFIYRIPEPKNNKVEYLGLLTNTREFNPVILWSFYQEDIPTIVSQLKTILAM